MKLPNGYGSVYKLSGNRRKPYVVKKTLRYELDEDKSKAKRKDIIIGYAETKKDGLQMLAAYNSKPYDLEGSKLTFSEVYELWSESHFPQVSESSVTSYRSAYKVCEPLYNRRISELKLVDLQSIIDGCDKNYPTLKKIKTLFQLMYKYAMKYDYVAKDYSKYVDVQQYKDRNPNKYDRDKLTTEEISKLWDCADNKYCQIALMMIYSGVRIGELLALKKENVHLEEQYIDIVKSKTVNGIRKVPIADKVLPFYKEWYELSDSEYLLVNEKGKPFGYDKFYKNRYMPVMKTLGINKTPHCCRHTTSSMLTLADVNPTIIKKIVGHSGVMSLTEQVYTHFNIQELLDAINKI
ncbi:MAG: site-specific integrase [Mogibacterium sp.]|nr:site-specific integrase [Mogibacterium sp.]